MPLTPWKASLHVPGLGLREHSKPLLGARRKRVRRHGGRGVRRHKSDIPSYLRSWAHRGALFSAAPRSPGPAGVHRDFTPQRTAAAERAALGARELVPTAEGLLSGASRTSGGSSHSVPGPDPATNRAGTAAARRCGNSSPLPDPPKSKQVGPCLETVLSSPGRERHRVLDVAAV